MTVFVNTPMHQETIPRAVTGRGTALFPDEPHTLTELFYKAVAKYDRPDALNYKADGKWQNISSKEMIARAENIALGLYSLGLRKGDRAAIRQARRSSSSEASGNPRRTRSRRYRSTGGRAA